MRRGIQQIETALSRATPKVVSLDGEPARAAVGILLDPRQDDVHVFFIHRAEHDGDPWSGHMGFPGGFREHRDPGLTDTVAREVREEIGVDLERSARLLGRLDEIQGIARGRQLPLVISPFLYELTGSIEVRPNREVQDVLWVPLAFLAHPDSETTVERRIGEQRLPLPAFVYAEKIIWGLTFRMVRNFLDVIRRDG